MSRKKTKSAKSKAVNQVRIIGGRFKRQNVAFIDADGLRPTPDRLRETLFNWVQFDLHDISVLDLCAGSGALGFEALSRGARHATFIEKNAHQADLIAQTAKKLKLSPAQATVLTGDALTILQDLPAPNLLNSFPQSKLERIPVEADSKLTQPFHLVFLDPPYDLTLWVPCIHQLLKQQLINSQTLLYIEDRRPLHQTLSDLQYQFEVIKSSKVGQAHASLITLNIENIEG